MSDKKYFLLTSIFIILSIVAGLAYLYLKTNRTLPQNQAMNPSTEKLVEETETFCDDKTIYTQENFNDAFANPEKVCNINFAGSGWTNFSQDIFSFPNIEKLQIEHNRLTDLPADFSKFTKLKELTIQNNKLDHIPAAIFSLKNLEILNLSNNEIAEIPSKIQNLTKLRVLKMVGNKISSLPASMGNISSFETIDFIGNNISILPDTFSKLDNLDSLYLDQNKFSEFPQAIVVGMVNLVTLSIPENQITKLPDSLANQKHIKYIALNGNPIDPLEIKSLKEALPQAKINF